MIALQPGTAQHLGDEPSPSCFAANLFSQPSVSFRCKFIIIAKISQLFGEQYCNGYLRCNKQFGIFTASTDGQHRSENSRVLGLIAKSPPAPPPTPCAPVGASAQQSLLRISAATDCSLGSEQSHFQTKACHIWSWVVHRE